MTNKLILDTHIIIWYIEGINLNKEQIKIIDDYQKNNSLYISAISIWEISMLASKNKITFSVSLKEWIDSLLSIPGLNLVNLSPSILIESCNLTNLDHKDPADRMIISTARNLNAHLMTADQKILDYAKQGHLKVI